MNTKKFGIFNQVDRYTILDLGASGGLDKRWEMFKDQIRVVGYEPDKVEFDRLVKKNIGGENLFINAAVGKGNEEMKFYVARKQQLSSVFEPDPLIVNKFLNAERFDITNVLNISLTTVDDSLKHSNVGDIDFLKIDTQGSELDILKGALNTLKSVVSIEVEVEFNQIYKDQPLYGSVDKFVRDLGFELYDLETSYYLRKENNSNFPSKGQIMFANAIYFPNDSYLKSIANYETLVKLIFASLVYKKYDYTLYLIKDYKILLSDDLCNEVYSYLNHSAKQNSSLLNRIYRVVRKFI